MDGTDRWVCIGAGVVSAALVVWLMHSGSFSPASFLAALILLIPVGILAYLLGLRHGWDDMRKTVRSAADAILGKHPDEGTTR